jgi:hypothetical protein
MTEYGKGVLYDLSSRGALFASERDLVIGTQIHFVVPAENAQTPGVEVFATISRKTFYPTRKRKFEYGCQFEYRQTDQRRTLNIEVKYRTSWMSAFENGLLWNISSGSALFSARRELDTDISVHLVLLSDNPQKPPMQAIATIIRKEFYPMRRRKFGYGCRFGQTIKLD